MTRSLRIVVVDDHPVFRNGMRAQIDTADGLEFAGEATSGETAIAVVDDVVPDVVLMDLQLPGINGIDATRRVVSRHPEIGVLVLTMFEDDDSVFAAMRAGARGYVLKGSSGADIIRAIQAVGNGEAIFGPSIGRRIADFLAAPPRPDDAFPQLTSREREVLELLAAGCSNQQMAKQFVLSAKTIRNHVSNIFTKLQVADRRTAIAVARDAGLGH